MITTTREKNCRNLYHLWPCSVYIWLLNGRIFYIEESAITVPATAVGNNATLSELTLVDGNGAPVTLLGLLTSSTRVDLRFGIDAAGELLISSKQNGQIWRLASLNANATSTPTATHTPTTTLTPDPLVTATPTITPVPTATVVPSLPYHLYLPYLKR